MDSEQRTRHKPDARSESAARPRKGPGRQTPGQTKQRNLELLHKALDLFLEQGFERTTIDAIAASVGMAKRTVYLRYGDKTRLFKAALQRAIEEWIVPVDRLRAAETDDVEETLLRHRADAGRQHPESRRLASDAHHQRGIRPNAGNRRIHVHTRHRADDRLSHGSDSPTHPARRRQHSVSSRSRTRVSVSGRRRSGEHDSVGHRSRQAEIDKHTRYCVRFFLHGLLHPSP